MKSFRCKICRKYVKEPGNNPAPLFERGKVCNSCNVQYVLPARIKQFEERGKSKNEL